MARRSTSNSSKGTKDAGLKTILLVEDNPDDEALVLHALKKNKVQANLSVVHDGLEALDYFSHHFDRPPELVLLDLKMPGMDGLEVLRRLREIDPERTIPVVVFTSSSEEQDVRRCYELGASSYVRKPIEFGPFTEVIRGICAYWLGLNVISAPPRRAARVQPHAH